MVSSIGPSQPLEPPYKPETPMAPISHEDVAHYLEIQSHMEVLSFVLSVVQGYQGFPAQQSLSQWLEQHQTNQGFFSGSVSSAQSHLENEQSEVQEILKDRESELNKANTQLQDLETEYQRAPPWEKKEIGQEIKQLQGAISDIKSQIRDAQNLQTLLNSLQVSQGPASNTFIIQGPANWLNELSQYDKEFFG